MSYLYLTKSTYKLGVREGQLTVFDTESNEERKFPFAKIDGISIFGMPQLTTQLIRKCIASDVTIQFYSDDGHYFGSISSSHGIDPMRQKRQICLTDNREFCLTWSKRIVEAKIRNSLALLGSMADVYIFDENETQGLWHSLRMIDKATSLNEVLGFEGNAAKCYFQCLPNVLRNDAFLFKGRSSRPPRDPFNSMLSFGYSIVFRNIIGAIERHGLHPYFAFMHQLRSGHEALASDLIEEYRAPIVDKTVITLINQGDVGIDGFYTNEAGAVYMSQGVMQKLTDELSSVIATSKRYFYDSGDNRAYGFQAMLDKKLVELVTAIELCDATAYTPYIWVPSQ